MIGKTISHYRIIEKLGEGGMGIVYKAEDIKLGRTVALKFLTSQVMGTGESKDRFIHEARAAAALNHTNICTIYEIDETEGQSFIAMEYVEGENLKDRIQTGPLKLKEAVDLAVQMAQGLQDAHEKGIVHRDIKSANIMITSKGTAKIMDFGLAKTADWTQITREGTTLGTVAYMSPEQARSEPIDRRTDVWSLGVVLYEMVVGQLPFKGDYDQAVLFAIMNEEPEPVTSLRTGVPIDLERVIGKALAKEPDERYQHADELVADIRVLEKKIEHGGLRRPAARTISKRRVSVPLIVTIIVIVAAVILGRLLLFPKRAGPIDSIAVLLLKSLSGDPGQEYFTDGMTEALIADMAKISALRIISRTSVMRYKDTEKSLPEIAKALGVDAVVEGSVLLAGDRVRITAQLIEAATDRHIWAESYERDLRDILSLQRDVARAIADEIKVTLTPEEEVSLGAAPQIDPTAHEAYLKGRYHWNKRMKVDLERSIEYFQQAIDKDPDFAMAYVGLAETYCVLADWGFQSPKEMYPKAMETALKALEIDPALASVHATTGAVQWKFYYDHQKAEEEFKIAISLNPNYATAHQWYAEYLMDMRRFDEAITEIERALELDPLSLIMHCVRGSIYYYSKQYDKAIAALGEALKLDRDFWLAHRLLSLNYLEKGMYDEAIEAYKNTLIIFNVAEDHIASLEQAYRSAGIDGVNRWILDEGYRVTEGLYNTPYLRAVAFARIGEIDSTFVWLDKSYEAGTMYMTSIRSDPSFDSIRSDPRYDELLKKVGFKK